MDEIKLKAYAKLNLNIQILKKFSNNYHEISSLMQRIDLHDEITVRKANKVIYLQTNIEELNNDIERNTAMLASNYFFGYTKVQAGADIYIKKNIPHKAGLGGSSSNAAVIINALDKLYNTNLTNNEKLDLGLKVGCDVGFFLRGGTAIIKGAGDRIIKKKKLRDFFAIIIKPEFGISTKEAYASLDPLKFNPKSNSELLYYAYVSKNIDNIKKYTVNTFEEDIAQSGCIKKIKKDLLVNNAIVSSMTGSGSCVFGIYDNKETCHEAYCRLLKKYDEIYKSEFI